MKTATYNIGNGGFVAIEYDENAPCRICGDPVREASMGGTDVCPACDCGLNKDGSHWTPAQGSLFMRTGKIQKEEKNAIN